MASTKAAPQPASDSFVLSDMSVQSLARMWRMLDEDTDGLLQPDQLRTMIAAVGIPPTQQLVSGITQCAPEKWRDRGVDIDTVSQVAATLPTVPLYTTACAVPVLLRSVPDQRTAIHGCHRGGV